MTDYVLMFSVGLLGALHCLAMCGGLIMACSMKFGGGFSFSFFYNAGRIASYVGLGFLMGLLGKMLIATGFFGRFQSALPVLAGIFMIIIGMEMLGLMPVKVKRFFAGLLPLKIPQFFSRLHLNNKKSGAFILGMVNGFIPCGFLYAAGIKAASTAEPVNGALIMASLGAGTLLPLLFAGSFSGMPGKYRSRALSVFSSVIIIALGIKSIFFSGQFMDMLMKVYPLCTLS